MFRQNLLAERGQPARAYLERRGLQAEMVELFGVGYAIENSRALYQWLRRQNYSAELLRTSGLFSQQKEEICLFWHRLVFPVFDTQGRIIAFSGRQLDTNAKGPKYINSRESAIYCKGESLFGLYQSLRNLRRERCLLLCEGNFDVLAWHQAGVGTAAAPLGTAFTLEQAKLLKRYCDRVILAFDGDEAGQRAIYKAAFLLEQQEISSQVIPLAAGRDPSDILVYEGVGDLKSLARNPQDFFRFLAGDLERRFALDELTGISAALRFLSPFMKQMKEGLRRELYLAQFAKLFRLKPEQLAAEASWQYQKSGAVTERRPVQTSQSAPVKKGALAEKNLRENSSARKRQASLSPDAQSELVEREFWASLLLQADLYPEWQELLAELPWVSEDALLLQELLEQASETQDFNFETLCDRVSRRAPALGEWLLQKKLEPLQIGNMGGNIDYDLASYRRAILQQKYCGLQEFWLRQRREKALQQIQNLEAQGADLSLSFELLGEIQNLDRKLIELRSAMRQLQKELQYSSKCHNYPILES